MKNEQKFWRNDLKTFFRSLGHVNRVESGGTSIGMPDVNLQILHGPSWWIELKHARRGKLWEIRPGQRMWIKRRVECGGNVCVLARDDTLAIPSFLLIEGRKVQELENHDLGTWYANSWCVWDNKINYIELEQFFHEQAQER